jgi:hypothetical protein
MISFTLRPLYLVPIEQEVAGPTAGLDFSEKRFFLPLSEAKSSIFQLREFYELNASIGFCNILKDIDY